MPAIYSIAKYVYKLWLPLTTEQMAAYVDSANEREKTDAFINTLQVPVTGQASYTAAANELVSIKNKHSGAIAVAEANIVKTKWEARGLNATKMSSIMSFYGF